MKESQFNTSFFYETKQVIYNAFSNKFILLEPIVYDLYKASVIENKISEIPKYHEDLYETLLTNGIILENEIDEILHVKELSKEIDSSNEKFHLTINPTMNCNFKCWYCYEGHISNSKLDNFGINKIKALINNKTNSKDLKTFTLSWFGGEPLLYYKDNVLPIIKHTYKKCKEKKIKFNCTFTTNSYLINDEMIKDFIKYKVSGFQITLDGNKEEHNKVRFVHKNKGSYTKIISNIFKLARNDLFVSVRINYTKDKLNTVYDIFDDLIILEEKYRTNIKVDFQRVWQTEDTKKSRDEVRKLMSKFSNFGFKVSSVISNVDYVRNSCYADKKNQATINYDGNVFKCTAREFNPKEREGFLNDKGEIVWNEKYHARLNSKFKNKPCLSCRILPICNGGCTQQALEHKNEYCMYDFDEDRKIEIVKNKFLLMLNNSNID